MNECLIDCRMVTKTYVTEVETLTILSGLDLEIERGRTVAITGASGSGKSTLLSILGGLDRASSGHIRVGEWDLSDISESRLTEYRSRVVGFVFQFHYLLKDLTALENVALPALMAGLNRKAAFGKAEKILADMGLAGRAGHYPSQLSGGERQRTAIGRAIVNNPPLILADEPTGNLDSASVQGVCELLFKLPSTYGTTLVLATHDTGVAASADTHFKLSSGRLEKQ